MKWTIGVAQVCRCLSLATDVVRVVWGRPSNTVNLSYLGSTNHSTLPASQVQGSHHIQCLAPNAYISTLPPTISSLLQFLRSLVSRNFRSPTGPPHRDTNQLRLWKLSIRSIQPNPSNQHRGQSVIDSKPVKMAVPGTQM